MQHKPRLLVACEFSGIVRDAFIAAGWDAWSCDILPTEQPGPHIVNDVRNVLDDGWDMMIAHPPCTFLSYAGNRFLYAGGKLNQRRLSAAQEAFEFVERLWNAPIPLIALENPRGLVQKWLRKPDQIIEPYHFGHQVTKATCLWLKGLPPLIASLVCANPFVNWAKYGVYGENKQRARSRTFPGIAAAMAAQWGRLT